MPTPGARADHNANGGGMQAGNAEARLLQRSEILPNPALGARFRALLTFGQRLSFCAIHEAGFMAWAIDQRS